MMFPALPRRRLIQLGAAAALPMPAIAQTKATVLRFGGPMALTTNYGKAMAKLSEEAAKRSEGRLAVQVYPDSQLGGLKEMVTAVQLGTQSMVMVTPTWIANYARPLDILSLLYMAKSPEKLFAALDGSFGQMLAGLVEPSGFKILAWWNGGPRHMLNNVHPINTPDDLKGLKMRSQSSQVWLQSFRALGANPVNLDFPEIYLSLQQHTIDGYENPANDVVGGKFYEAVKYLSLTAHLFDIFVVAINKRQWDKLPPADQHALQDSADIATQYQRQAETEDVGQALTFLRTKIQVNDVSDANRALFAAKLQSVNAAFQASLDKGLTEAAIKALT
jgi:tripartite ATP-independent transporter DctP family solute receptor